MTMTMCNGQYPKKPLSLPFSNYTARELKIDKNGIGWAI